MNVHFPPIFKHKKKSNDPSQIEKATLSFGMTKTLFNKTKQKTFPLVPSFVVVVFPSNSP